LYQIKSNQFIYQPIIINQYTSNRKAIQKDLRINWPNGLHRV